MRTTANAVWLTAAFAMLVSLSSAQAAPTVCAPQPDGDTAPPRITPNQTAGQEAWNAGNLTLAVANFRPLAEDGNAVAQYALGDILMHGGCGVKQDKAEGISWLRKSAEAHNTEGEYLYGQAQLRGDGVPEDDKAAFDWTRRAAKADNVQAEVGLGYLYFTGRGVKQDLHQGVVWTVKAGEQGAPVALSNIARSYNSGHGLPKDLRRAMFWISAAMQRVPPTQWQMTQHFMQTRYTIARQLSVEEARKIEQDSQKWSPGKGSLADVLADADKWSADGGSASTDADMADH